MNDTPITPERWQQVQDVFHAVLACGDDTRAACLDNACRADGSLRADVERLIAAHHAAGSFGNQPLVKLESRPGRCSHCGCAVVADPGLSGLCAQCLLRLALGELDPALEPLAPGNVFGARYQVLKVLGRGGMGEVVHAFDLKLRVDVALKAVSPDRAGSDQAREQLRREVRSAREVISPNVCRIFDLIVSDGEELVSMEYIDGATLSDTLRERGPLTLQETQEIASQFLAGLESIHRAGLVHRDIKPENIMTTRAGRVVIMDFGLANVPDGTQFMFGTPGYMPPEQQLGEGVDARGDVFAAGVVLAEMLTVGGHDNAAARQSVWRAIRANPPLLPDGPWTHVLGRAVAANPAARYASAHELARALEEVTLRLPGFEQRHPYPGLAAFTADNAEYFFGREVETEQVWKKLERPRLLALIGPSGAGKSSFLRAGLLQALPRSWKAIFATPGSRPFQSLARALAPALAGDPAAVEQLLRFEEEGVALSLFNGLGRKQHVLLVIDQFEELFTQNPFDVQASFASLLGRLVVDADLCVIVSLRDDFLLRCQEHEGLRAIFSDLTPLGTLSRSALRRAFVQPALACGYRFEDEALVDEMVGAVSEERGALPLLAFAASRLWEQRDRDRGLLTREAYREIGGVAGALAQHAERTLERIGRHRTPIVRELFRNLVTSQGTRAVREREDLLSVFDRRDAGLASREEAEEVLAALVDARLLTSYERVGESGTSHRQVEVVHESLLAAWPQLVHWQAQDAEGAQIRDQLRQASQLWQDRGRPDDLLWSGTAYRDFCVWRERYPGSLSSVEEAFAKAATDRSERGRRRRQLITATMVAAVAIIALVTFALWRRSEALRGQAVAETQRAEAGKLFAMGERELDRHPTAALAYAIRGLELADNQAGRLLALRILQRGHVARVARVLDPEQQKTAGAFGAFSIGFSPTSEWLAWASNVKAQLMGRDGSKGPELRSSYTIGAGRQLRVAFDPRGERLVTYRTGDVRVLSIPGGQELRATHIENGRESLLRMGKDSFLTVTAVGQRSVVRAWPLSPGEPHIVGVLDAVTHLDATDRVLAYAQGGAVYCRSLIDWEAPPRLIAMTQDIRHLALSPDGEHVATGDGSNEVRIWPTTGRAARPTRILRSPGATTGLDYDPNGRWFVTHSFESGHPQLALFDLQAPWDAEPRIIQKGDTNTMGGLAFDRAGRWVATAHGTDVAFWPLDAGGLVLRGQSQGAVPSVDFSTDGNRLFSLSLDHGVRIWPLRGGETSIVAAGQLRGPGLSMARDDSGRLIAVSGVGPLSVIRLSDGTIQTLRGFSEIGIVGKPAFGGGGRLVAAGKKSGPLEERLIRVWDLDTGVARVFGPWSPGERLVGTIISVDFAGPDRLIASVRGVGVISVDLATADSRVLVPQFLGEIVVSTDHRFALGAPMELETAAERGQSPLSRMDLQTGTVQQLPAHGSHVTAVALDATNSTVATASFDGVIRIGSISGAEPHVLLGQEGEGAIYSLSFSPDGRWLAASGEGFSIHIWPVPNLNQRPLHQRSYDEFLSVLRGHTNFRAIGDSASPYGYKLEPGPFQGWATLPER